MRTLLAAYGPLTTRELAEVYDKPVDLMRSEMEALAAEGQVEKLPVRGGEFWVLPIESRLDRLESQAAESIDVGR